ncbi:AI-2E family transporter [Oceanobacillus oncorhynchi]|uniref:Pheromone autoinducer 2 transporter n=1 Tax=Oceanobacillus oncorhynchi TaxID=545501 RepID=A0A0A1MLY1_9BACI|nr:AI-2E family transporter [Oceanobacillus oncorhynchi]MDM8098891.1 AI-2E family transporter [Oceanobacillus oncorhynchi]CEI80692.1 pheromone autoinducer 2 transporter [Oceanobacillus oncorhynchi]
MTQKRWFQFFIFFICLFTLIFLISITHFIFTPVLQLAGAVALPIIGAGILYYLTRPLMNLLVRYKVPRILSIIIVFLVIIGVVTLFIVFIWPIARDQFENLMDSIPGMVSTVESWIGYWQENIALVPDQVIDAINNFANDIPGHIESVLNNVFGFLGSFIGQLVSIIAGIILVPFFLFFMLKDGEKLVPFILQFFSKKKAENLHGLLSKIDNVLSSFIQGQLLVSFAVGILLLIGYLIIGLEYAVVLALFGMMMNVIPFLGPYIAVVPAILVAGFQDPMNIIWIAIIMFVAQQLESVFISPNVMGQALNLHPLTVITVILAAGSIAGFLGILFAIPVYAIIRTIVIHFYQTFVDSRKNKDDALI